METRALPATPGGGHVCVLHSSCQARDSDSGPKVISRWEEGRRSSMSTAAVLVLIGESSPGVSRVEFPLFPKDVRGRVMPPSPMVIKWS